MTHLRIATLSAALLALSTSATSRAQSEKPPEKNPETPAHALELVGSTGYTQGFGSLMSGVDMQRVITPGFATELGAGYRIDPRWAVLLLGQYAEFDAERANAARGLVVSAAVAYHFAPRRRFDPWAQIGAGYRFLWETNVTPTPDVLTHGFELARVTLGLDVRASRDIAFAPIVGADLTLPLWETVGSSSSAIADPRVSTFVFVGMQARLDVTSAFVGVSRPVAETHITQATQCPPAPPAAQPIGPSLTASDELVQACKLALDDIDSAPKFDFDKSELLPADVAVLQKIAECFTTGPLKDSGVLLVGRADPRGSVPYNESLAKKRAESVAAYLRDHGVGTRIETTTRGKLDASGTSDDGWATDRRVDVLEIEIRPKAKDDAR